jgi:FKBP-type peptidyl-prolyl cis-trans isomerase 2
MKQTITWFTALSSVLALSGCSTYQEFVPLHETVRKEISSTEAYAEDCQASLIADVERSHVATYMGGGLLFALVDAAIESHREGCANDAMVDIQKGFTSYNAQEKVKAHFMQSLKQAQWLHAGQVQSVKVLDEPTQANITQKSKSDTVLTARLLYKFNPDLSVLTGTIYLTVYPTSQKLRALVNAGDPLDKPIFKVNVKAAEALPVRSKDLEDNAKQWSDNDNRLLKDALDKITNQAFANLDRVLKNPEYISDR